MAVHQLPTLFGELKMQWFGSAVMWCDNMSAASLAANSVFHVRTKHIEIDVHYVREQVASKAVAIQCVPSHQQVADILTKALSVARFEQLIERLQAITNEKGGAGEVVEKIPRNQKIFCRVLDDAAVEGGLNFRADLCPTKKHVCVWFANTLWCRELNLVETEDG